MQCKDAFQDYDVRRVDGVGLIQSSMLLKGVDGDLRLFAGKDE